MNACELAYLFFGQIQQTAAIGSHLAAVSSQKNLGSLVNCIHCEIKKNFQRFLQILKLSCQKERISGHVTSTLDRVASD